MLHGNVDYSWISSWFNIRLINTMEKIVEYVFYYFLLIDSTRKLFTLNQHNITVDLSLMNTYVLYIYYTITINAN